MSQALKAAMLPVTPRRIFLPWRTGLRLAATKGFIKIVDSSQSEIRVEIRQLGRDALEKRAHAARGDHARVRLSQLLLEAANHAVDHRGVAQEDPAPERFLGVG